MPCKHGSACYSCLIKQAEYQNKCPLCRERYNEVVSKDDSQHQKIEEKNLTEEGHGLVIVVPRHIMIGLHIFSLLHGLFNGELPSAFEAEEEVTGEEPAIERILRKRVTDGQAEYYVRWRGARSDEWLSEEAFTSPRAIELLFEYEESIEKQRDRAESRKRRSELYASRSDKVKEEKEEKKSSKRKQKKKDSTKKKRKAQKEKSLSREADSKDTRVESKPDKDSKEKKRKVDKKRKAKREKNSSRPSLEDKTRDTSHSSSRGTSSSSRAKKTKTKRSSSTSSP
eukprot:TRINITY_DN27543_c0_g1_i1.p1 TRINITY_DN27543_c0_g1~~TRINITY_DN27543_c0_g1_i1.p1  ORF type:complete len:311 (+),score=-11.62 TRINITY_DN27543_c0_g1_i1:86-934(+)